MTTTRDWPRLAYQAQAALHALNLPRKGHDPMFPWMQRDVMGSAHGVAKGQPIAIPEAPETHLVENNDTATVLKHRVRRGHAAKPTTDHNHLDMKAVCGDAGKGRK
jgi:hypothetical protein